MSDTTLTAPTKPCGSCPYRRDVPSGIWSREEYDKLPSYDGETWEQSTALFLCHQRDGNLCGGWLACHGAGELLALRIHGRKVDANVFNYDTSVPVFCSGREARAYGVKDIKQPGRRARKMISGLMLTRSR
jgi:hypothetical protein